MAHDQLHSAILRGHGKNALYIGGTMRTRRTDAHRTLKYALIILPRRVLMPLTRPTCRTLLSSYPCSSSTYDPLRFPTLCRRSRIFHTAVLHAETRQKNAIPAPAVSCHPAIFLFSRNVRCQEPSAVPEIFPVPRAVEGGGRRGLWRGMLAVVVARALGSWGWKRKREGGRRRERERESEREQRTGNGSPREL